MHKCGPTYELGILPLAPLLKGVEVHILILRTVHLRLKGNLLREDWHWVRFSPDNSLMYR